jgi:hypothetical protein
MNTDIIKEASALFLKALIIGVLLHVGIAFTVVESPVEQVTTTHTSTVLKPPAR